MSHFPEIEKLIDVMIEDISLRRATVFRSPTFTIKLTRSQPARPRDRAETMLLTFGVPNHPERKFIKACQKAGEPFPVKKVRLQFWPPKRKVKR